MTMRKRLAYWYSGLLTVIIIIFGVAVITVSRLTLLGTIDQVISGAADEIATNINLLPVGEFGTTEYTQIFFATDDMFSAPGVSVQIWRTHDTAGHTIEPELIRASDDIAGSNVPLDADFVRTDEIVYNSTTTQNQSAVRVISYPVTIGDEAVATVQVATPLSAVQNSNDQLLVITIISALICIGVSLFIGRWLSDRLLEPINIIRRAAESIANADDLSTRIEWQGEMDELGELTEVFNKMMVRLEHLFSVQQRFIGDVSHELRTPLTSILGHLELMERYGVDEDSISAINREANRMSRMVNDLLLLTRADFGELEVDMYPLDLDAIVMEVFEQAEMLKQNRDLNIIPYRIEAVHINGNADRLRQLLTNLLSNAIKFTSDGGTITLGVYTDGDYGILEISDTGIGIAEDDLQRIFDRFFQADTSRVRHEENDGAGLGLSIARWIVDIHGGMIDVQSTIGEGTQFIIRLPLEGKKLNDTKHEQSQSVTDSGILRIKTRSLQ